jgi:hypothetical protein
VVVAHAARAGSFRVAHWLEAVQAVQIWAAEQMGVAPEHCELAVQPTHLFVLVSQTGVAPEHCVLLVHCTHCPSARQAGSAAFFAAHWLEAVHVVQVSVEPQIGVVAGQVALAVQPTHLFVLVSQTGVAPEHRVLLVHWTHCPSVRHAGREESFAAH